MQTIKRAGYTGHLKDGVEQYFGIRYAGSNGSFRFLRPELVTGKSQMQVQDSRQVPIFEQLPSRLYTAMGSRIDLNPQDESAFFLNVSTPSSGSSLPVLFFIHGGAWMTGAGTIPWYDGSKLSERGAVVVTLNYRLGGLAHLTEESEDRERNPAYFDILTALVWVQENIADFGGDPDRVTIAGQSAGSWYAHFLNISENARGLFNRVAYLSHASNRPWDYEYQDALSGQVLSELNLDTFKKAKSHEIISAGMSVLRRKPATLGGVPTPYLPTTSRRDAEIFCDATESAKASHAQAVYIRTTGTETSAFFFQSEQERGVDTEMVERVREAGGHKYQQKTHLSPYENLVAMTSEIYFDGPSRALADEYANNGVPTYLRIFDQSSDLDGFLSGHCFDLPFQFGSMQNWSDAPMLQGIGTDKFEYISNILITELVDFIKEEDHKSQSGRHVSGQAATLIDL